MYWCGSLVIVLHTPRKGNQCRLEIPRKVRGREIKDRAFYVICPWKGNEGRFQFRGIKYKSNSASKRYLQKVKEFYFLFARGREMKAD